MNAPYAAETEAQLKRFNNQQRCINCFKINSGASPCPQCGWRPPKKEEANLYLAPGTVLYHKYMIGSTLGHGGFGITYLGWDLNLEIRLAIKEYLPRDMATRTQDHHTITPFTGPTKEQFKYGLEKFLEEARALAKFEDFPGIVSVRDYFKANSSAYFVMHFVEGVTLKEYLVQKGGRIPFDLALKILMPVFDALQEVHRTGLLHRDISPDNIYITEDGRVKILDFGAARYATGEHSRSLSVILKPGYAPEEQYRSKGKQGPWTDIYSLCATLYRTITGKTPPESLDRLAEESLEPPSALGVEISSQAESALLKGLSIRATERFQSVLDLQKAMLKDDEPLPMPEPTPPPAPEPKPEPIPDPTPEPLVDEKQRDSSEPLPSNDEPSSKKIEPDRKKGNRFPLIAVLISIFLLIGIGVGSKYLKSLKPVSSSFSSSTTDMSTQSQSTQKTKTENQSAQKKKSVVLRHGDRFQNNLGMEFVYIAPGKFWMGSPSNEPKREDNETRHQVALTKGYYIQTTEVTQGQWEAIMGSNPSSFKDCGSDCPVENVSWNDIQKYVKALKNKDNQDYRLPTEAEWEYAARAGTNTLFAFGDCLSTSQANYDGNSPMPNCSKGTYRKRTVSVGSFSPNAWGLYDMHGNVYEWCQDWYGEYDTNGNGLIQDPIGPSTGSYRVLRGGGWSINARICRSADRGGSSPGYRGRFDGFRLAFSPRSAGR